MSITPTIAIADRLAFTKNEVCAIFGVKKTYVEKLIADRSLKAKWLNSRNVRIDAESARQWFDSLPDDRSQAPPAQPGKKTRAA